MRRIRLEKDNGEAFGYKQSQSRGRITVERSKTVWERN